MKKNVSKDGLAVRTHQCPTEGRETGGTTAKKFHQLYNKNMHSFFHILVPCISLAFYNHFSKVMKTIHNHGQGSQLCSVTECKQWQHLALFSMFHQTSRSIRHQEYIPVYEDKLPAWLLASPECSEQNQLLQTRCVNMLLCVALPF